MATPPSQARPAARAGDPHCCPQYRGDTAHQGGLIMGGAATVFVEGMPAARMGDAAQCRTGDVQTVAAGSPTVFVEDQPAARLGDATAHGGTITSGSATVHFG